VEEVKLTLSFSGEEEISVELLTQKILSLIPRGWDDSFLSSDSFSFLLIWKQWVEIPKLPKRNIGGKEKW